MKRVNKTEKFALQRFRWSIIVAGQEEESLSRIRTLFLNDSVPRDAVGSRTTFVDLDQCDRQTVRDNVFFL